MHVPRFLHKPQATLRDIRESPISNPKVFCPYPTSSTQLFDMSRTTSSNAQAADPAAISLTRLLNHLEESLLSPNADPSLRTSNYNRTKLSSVGAITLQPFMPSILLLLTLCSESGIRAISPPPP